MLQKQHSEEFKKSAVQKLLLRGNRTVQVVCDEIGISTPTFYEWKKKYAKIPGMKNSERRPQDFSTEEKFKAVCEFEGLAEENRGEFLRKSGLHTEHILQWKKAMQAGLQPESQSKETKAEVSQLKLRNKELEKDLTRKDRALAETTALLVLKKKADLLWGTGENE
jgi:transposase-like protein